MALLVSSCAPAAILLLLLFSTQFIIINPDILVGFIKSRMIVFVPADIYYPVSHLVVLVWEEGAFIVLFLE